MRLLRPPLWMGRGECRVPVRPAVEVNRDAIQVCALHAGNSSNADHGWILSVARLKLHPYFDRWESGD